MFFSLMKEERKVEVKIPPKRGCSIVGFRKDLREDLSLAAVPKGYGRLGSSRTTGQGTFFQRGQQKRYAREAGRRAGSGQSSA